ncbi:hypothetical protein F5B22DRAFT_612147, partial [Xylaria bambusicola]|uniref:uncharacterized protein n=1 Tax=Xylaria bambusicola TaxID=326684 RepID=UPI0020084F85
MAKLPPLRIVERTRAAFLPDPMEWDMLAAVGQCVGRQVAEPCDRCKAGNGGFSGGCILPPLGIQNLKKPWCCLCCQYQWQYGNCSFEPPEERKKRLSKKNKRGKKVKKAQVKKTKVKKTQGKKTLGKKALGKKTLGKKTQGKRTHGMKTRGHR